jgi:hypothetical protein
VLDGVGGHHGAAAPAQLEQALVAQLLVGVQHGVLVDLQRRGELPGGGQALARTHLAGQHRGTHLRGELLEERCRRGGVDAEQHCPSIIVLAQH